MRGDLKPAAIFGFVEKDGKCRREVCPEIPRPERQLSTGGKHLGTTCRKEYGKSMNSNGKTRFGLMRHAKTQWNLDKRIQGQKRFEAVRCGNRAGRKMGADREAGRRMGPGRHQRPHPDHANRADRRSRPGSSGERDRRLNEQTGGPERQDRTGTENRTRGGAGTAPGHGMAI